MAEPKSYAARQDLLAKMLSERGHTAGPGKSRRFTAIPRAPRDGSLPLSYAQERLWFFEQMRPGTAVYHIPMVFRLTGRLDEARLRAALSAMVERHEVLRTVIRSVDGKATQTVLDAMDLPFETGAAPTTAAALERVLAVAVTPFDLADGPLLRFVLQRVGAAEWVLGVVLHHIVFDGWSMGVFVHDLTTLYRNGRLDPLPIQYGDYAVWQKEWLASGVLAEQLDYWRDRLAGAPVLQLATDRPRPPAQSFRGAREKVTIPAPLTAAVRRLCQAEGVTPFMLLLTVFKVLLSRYTGQTDIVVGAPIANRARVETEALLGFFINTVVLRTDLSGEPTGRALLARVRDTALGAYAHQDLPFERLVDELRPERDLSRSALFQTLFVLQNAPVGTLDLPDLSLAPLAVDTGIAKFDLTFDLQEAGELITGEVEYSTDLFDRETVRGLFAAYQTLLTALTADPDAPISQLPVLDEPARWRLDQVNTTHREWTGGLRLHELVEEQTARTPDATALICGADRLTYRELDSRADRLAQHLRGRGVGPDAIVGVCVERSADLVTALLGVLKAGGAYLPMDPSYPIDRLTYMLEDSCARIVLTDPAHVATFAANMQVTLLDDLLDGSPAPAGPPPEEAGPGNLAYVIYTSGSTGRPKGVMIEHGTIVNHLRGTTGQLGFTADDRLLAVTTVSFDIAGLEIFAPLSVGATCVLTAPGDSADAQALMRLLDSHDITLMQATPATWRLLRGAGWAGRARLRALCGGEAFPPDLAADLTGRTAEVWNMYGPTETTVWSLTTRVDPTATGITTVPIGSPMANTRVYVLDPSGRRVPPGAVGELLIGGHGVARGYLSRPALTAERFIPDVHGGRPGERLYRTGDLVRQRPDGRLEFLGRVDHQVKLRGFRIELGEIEAALSRQDHVRACAVVLREDDPGDKRLVGYLVGDGAELSVSAIRDDLKLRLPDYMVPSTLVVLDALPLTANGKVDRKALPVPATGREQLGTPFTPPGAVTERVLAEVWADVLGVPAGQVGVHDSFFDLGGNSLLAVALVSRISALLDFRVPLQDLFARPTVAAVAAMLDARPNGAQSVSAIARAPRDRSLPLSFAQERLWFFEQLRPGTATYHVPVVFRLRGALDEGRLREALAGVVARHEVLRTVYPAVDGKAEQVMLEHLDVPFETVDLSGLGAAAYEAALQRTDSATAEGFDLAAGPLLRALLIRVGTDDHLFVVVMHHIVFDAWTMGVFVRELTQLYRGTPLAPLTVQYADYAVWQRRRLESGDLDAETAYWRARLTGAPALLELPTDRARIPSQSFRGGRQSLVLPAPLAAAVRRTAQAEGVTTFMLLLAAFKLVLSRYGGQTDVVVGAPIAGRTHIDTEPLIGFFINTLALRTDLSDDPPVRELLARVRETTLGGLAHQELPFERLVDELQPNRDLSHSPLFQVLLNYQEEAEIDVRAGGLHWSVEPDSTRASNFDLTLYALEKAAGLELAVAHSADLFDGERIQALLGHLVEALHFITSTPRSPLSALRLSGPAAPETVPAPDGGTDLAEVFARRVALNPARVALVASTGSRTYAQLAGDVDSLVLRLGELGVGPRDRLRITCRRDHRMVVGLLAAARIGCMVVLVSDKLPAGRQQRLDAIAHPTVRLLPDDGTGLLVERADEWLPGPEGFGYVLFTSGSTGTPKAVLADGRPLAAFLAWYSQEFALTDADRFAVLSASGHDPILRDVLAPLVVGATSYWPDEEVLRDPARLLAWLAGNGITVLNISPALGAMLRTVVDTHTAPSVRLVGSGGDVLTAPLVRDLRRLFPAAEVANYYGATETPQVVSCHRVREDAGTATVPLGRGANGAVLRIHRSGGTPAGTGELGEIHVHSPHLARGYLDATEDGLVVRPLAATGTGGYPTGDLGRYRPDGLIDFHGRRDRQAKVRGYRIELADIDASLATLPHVAESAVALDTGTGWLVACVVLDHPPTDVDRLRDEFRDRLRAQLPEYMVPQLVLTLDALPRLAAGKVDAAELIPFARERRTADRATAAPGSPLELILAEVWTSTLEVAPARLDESFFDTGNSLLLTQFVVRVNAVLGPHLTVADAFHNPTVAALRSLLAGTPAERAAQEILADVHADLQEEGSPL